MANTLTLPEEFVTRVDFGKFWEAYIRGPLTEDMLLQAKRDLLDTGVPAMTVYAYFFHLFSVQAREVEGFASLIEHILDDLWNLDDDDAEFLEINGIAQ